MSINCLSRGLDPDELKEHDLWWHGPKWLIHPKKQWPKNPKIKLPEDNMELKKIKVLVSISASNNFLVNMTQRFSSFTLLARVTARIRRLFSRNSSGSKYLTVEEVSKERKIWIKLVQESAFKQELMALRKGKPIDKSSKILCLHPRLEDDGILRVGGRLKEALVDYESKHQIIIPKDSILTKLIINDAHERTKHGGTQLTATYTKVIYTKLQKDTLHYLCAFVQRQFISSW